MDRRKSMICLMLVIVFCSVVSQAIGKSSIQPERKAAYDAVKAYRSKMITQKDRKAAASRVAAKVPTSARTLSSVSITGPTVGQGDVPDYFSPTVPNWAYTPKLRKFVDTLAGLGPDAKNSLNQYIPVAVPDRGAYPGLTPDSTSDYYEIALVQYTQKLHSDLPPTTLRGYVQIDTPSIPDTATKFALKYPDGSPILDKAGNQVYSVDKPRYLGPMIIAKKDVPVRVKFTNYLPTGTKGGDLFIPVDTTVMGAGMGPNMAMPMMVHRVGETGTTFEVMTMEDHTFKAGQRVMFHGFTPAAYNGEWIVLAEGLNSKAFRVKLKSDPGGMPTALGEIMEMYTQNRAVVHLHGGITPWISDGTPHQWVTPAGENTNYPQGVSVQEVPDMPGCESPDDGSTTLYYTNQQSARLMFYHDHVYGITRLNVYAGEAAGYMIEDDVEKALVASGAIPADQIPLIIQDKTFVDAETIGSSDPTWRWGTGQDEDGNGYPDYKTGDLWVPHVYMPAQNPYDLSGMAAMGRWHYGPWFWPPTTGISHQPIPNPYYDPENYPWQPPEIPDVPDPSMGMESFNDTPLVNGTAYPTVNVEPKAYRFRILNAANDRFWNLQLYEADGSIPALHDGRTHTEVKMVPAVPNPNDPTWPKDYDDGNPTWPVDGRDGGVPDWKTRGPEWIQIGTEGGFLPMPVVIPQRPIDWNVDVTTFNAGLVNSHSLLIAPAERADVIVDFSAYAGKTLILYNDAPAAFPAPDARYDYFTGMPDMTDTGGHYPTDIGYGPNTRTIMQIKVADTTPAPAFDVEALEAVWESTDSKDGVFKQAQKPIIVGQSVGGQDQYDRAYNTTFPTTWPNWGVARIHDTSLKFKTLDGNIVTIPLQRKAIQDEMGETFDDYGRMSGKLGLQLPNPQAGGQTFVLQSYVDPATEVIKASMTPLTPPMAGDGTQIWKITHNGVDTHPIHFHLFDVQLINRVGWDNGISLPEPNEMGWKDTIRVSPLEDTIVALRPVAPKVPFKLPDSIRLLDPVMPEGATWRSFDPITAEPVTITNTKTNFGWEYMWHCHILSHEEMEMMRPISFVVSPAPPSGLTATAPTMLPALVTLNWVNNATTPAATNLLVQRATDAAFSQDVTTLDVTSPTATTYTDTNVEQGTTYYYRVRAENDLGYSTWSDSASATTPAVLPLAPTSLTAVVVGPTQIDLSWTDNSDNEKGFRLERAVVSGSQVGIYSIIGPFPPNGTTYSDKSAVWGVTYSYRVVAFNTAGESPSDAVTAKITGSDTLTLGAVRSTVADGSLVRLTGVVPTGVFPGLSAYYVEQPDRAAGIRVSSASQPSVGQVGIVEGRIETIDGERQIVGGVFTPLGGTNPIKPMMLTVRHIGGGDAGLVPGMTGKVGINNVGLLLRVFGKVVSYGSDYFTMTDGSGTVKVAVPSGVTAPMPGQSVLVTGNCSVEFDGTNRSPKLLARSQSDILVLPHASYTDVVTNWNDITVNTIKTAGLTSITAARVLAMVHCAVYDSVNSISGSYQPYRMSVAVVPDASKEAAAAASAHRVLKSLFPAQLATLDAALEKSLMTVPDGAAKIAGVAVGETIADDMVSWRSTDHSSDMGMFMGGSNPGQWRPTLPNYAHGMMPLWGTVTPFAMATGSQFRLSNPPALDSSQYAEAVNETKALGMKNSPSRTAEQTQTAYFWADSPGTVTTVGRWNAIAREAAIARGYTLEENARLFAILNATLADAGISSWDNKYHYALWRPITAIREAGADGNPLTEADTMWMPELMTPAFPEYASAHSTFSGAGAEVLKRCFGSDYDAISIASFADPAAYRSYSSFSQVADEAGMSRIYGGIHFRFSDVAGKTTGRSIAGYVYDNFFRPVPPSP